MLRLDLAEMSTKLRTGGPKDQEPDLALPVWAGVIPLQVRPGVAIPNEGQQPGLSMPEYSLHYSRPGW